MNATWYTSSKFIHYSGTAVDIHSSQFYYTEEHEEILTNGEHTKTNIIYRNSTGEIIVNKTIDYASGKSTPSFIQEDLRDGYSEGAEVNGEIVKLFYKKKKSEELKTKELKIPSPVVIDGGFNYFVKDHWDEVLKGKTLKFNFAAPSQLDYFSFRIKKIHEIILNKKSAVVFKMEADNFVVRQLIDPIILTYDLHTKRLMKYEGLSNINDGQGKSYHVQLTYPTVGP